MFPILKLTHLAAVALTLLLFVLRSAWAFQGSALLRHPVMRWLPHVNDTVLLGGALGTAAAIGQYPFVNDWLTAKVLALVLYIVLGHITLWRCRGNAQRVFWFALSLGVFAYIMPGCPMPRPKSVGVHRTTCMRAVQAGLRTQALHQPLAATSLPGNAVHGSQSPVVPWICTQLAQSLPALKPGALALSTVAASCVYMSALATGSFKSSFGKLA